MNRAARWLAVAAFLVALPAFAGLISPLWVAVPTVPLLILLVIVGQPADGDPVSLSTLHDLGFSQPDLLVQSAMAEVMRREPDFGRDPVSIGDLSPAEKHQFRERSWVFASFIAARVAEHLRAEQEPRHAFLQSQRVLITVAVPDFPASKLSGDSMKLLADAELAIDVFPDERRGKVIKYRYGPTDKIEVDVALVKVAS